jgi:hypothetical protein
VWDGGDGVTVGAHYVHILVELTSIDVDDPVIARTSEALAGFLAGRYSTPEASWALGAPWEAQEASVRRAMHRRMRQLRNRVWLDRVTRRRARPVKPPSPG